MMKFTLVSCFAVINLSIACLPAMSQAETQKRQLATTETSKQTAGVQWFNNLNAATAAANQQGKLLLVDIGAPWCPWCNKMDQDTYTDKGVAEALNENFVCVKLNSDDGAIGSQFATQYGIESLPTVFVGNPRTRSYTMRPGYLDATDFIAMLKQVETMHSSSTAVTSNLHR